MKQYTINDKPALTITWLDQTGVEQGTVTSPTITIKKYDHVGNSWSTEINGVAMTQLSGSTYYYEYDISRETVGYDYKVLYNATITGLSVEATEMFRIIDIPPTQSEIQQLRTGNIRYDFSIATVAVSARNVTVGAVDYMTIYEKLDGSADWSNPTSTKTLYFWYNSDGNCISRKESN